MIDRLNKIVLLGLLLFVTNSGVSTQSVADAASGEPLEMLVLGDSHIGGQGLFEKNKFYFIVKEWLEHEILARPVRLKVKAHSGARITLHPEELARMTKQGLDVTKFYDVETNLSEPSIRTQVDAALGEYTRAADVDLILLTGCITDVLVGNTINPFYPEGKFRKRVKRFCGESMFELLDYVTASFPNATVVVAGYFPVISPDSDVKKLLTYFLEILKFPKKLRFLFTNVASREGFKLLRGRVLKRNRIWLADSNRELKNAVERINARLTKARVIFVETPIREENTVGTKMPMLFEMGDSGLPNDETGDARKIMCRRVFADKKHRHYGRFSTRMCELASFAHPNILGSRAYAEVINERLTQVLAK